MRPTSCGGTEASGAEAWLSLPAPLPSPEAYLPADGDIEEDHGVVGVGSQHRHGDPL